MCARVFPSRVRKCTVWDSVTAETVVLQKHARAVAAGRVPRVNDAEEEEEDDDDHDHAADADSDVVEAETEEQKVVWCLFFLCFLSVLEVWAQERKER